MSVGGDKPFGLNDVKVTDILDAPAVITGEAVTSDGGDCMPWFKVYEQSLGDDCDDDIHVLLQ